jgi:hypothetical protein
MTEKTIYELKLHEIIEAVEGLWVRRVPGGWIYTEPEPDSSVFVPYTKHLTGDEFDAAAKP